MIEILMIVILEVLTTFVGTNEKISDENKMNCYIVVTVIVLLYILIKWAFS